MNQPCIGQKATFYPSRSGGNPGPVRAAVEKVWSDSCVNLLCVDGTVYTSVFVLEDLPGVQRPDGYFCVLDRAQTEAELAAKAEAGGAPQYFLQPALAGYRQLDRDEAAHINSIKQAGAQLQQLMHQVHVLLQQQEALAARGNTQLLEQHKAAEPRRWLQMARTDLQTGVMRLVRAVAQPAGF